MACARRSRAGLPQGSRETAAGLSDRCSHFVQRRPRLVGGQSRLVGRRQRRTKLPAEPLPLCSERRAAPLKPRHCGEECLVRRRPSRPDTVAVAVAVAVARRGGVVVGRHGPRAGCPGRGRHRGPSCLAASGSSAPGHRRGHGAPGGSGVSDATAASCSGRGGGFGAGRACCERAAGRGAADAGAPAAGARGANDGSACPPGATTE
mmetsp:Transcript_4188/g.17719  ORF Transcript_4188/g.17719 Transcript_4188/m.17719 type:complete len:206 (-) Transcript_4188:532-1149(-)